MASFAAYPIDFMHYLFMKRPASQGRCYIVCKLTYLRSRKVLATGLLIAEIDWDTGRKLPLAMADKLALMEWERRLLATWATVAKQPAPSLAALADLMATHRHYYSVADLVAHTIQMAELRGVATSTLQVYRRHMAHLAATGYLHGPATGLTADEVLKVYKVLCQKLDSSTARQVMKLLRTAYKSGMEQGLVVANPCAGLRLAKKQPARHQLSAEDLAALLGLKADGPVDRARRLFLLLAFSGARYSDWGQIRPENVITVKGRPVLHYLATKTGNPAWVPVGPILQSLWEDGYHLDRKMSNVEANRNIKKACAKADIAAWEKVTMHWARRSFGQNLVDVGYSLEAVAAALSHSDIRTTQRHYVQPGLNVVVGQMLRIAQRS